VLLGIFVLALIIEGIIIAGSPISQKDIKLDNNRLQAFNNIKYQIENYYRANHKMPNLLSDLSLNINIQDPETKTNFDYKIIPPYSYQLCTTFSTDNSKTAANYNNYGSDSAMYKIHKKGHDCMTFKLSDYVINSARTPSQKINNTLSVLNVNSSPSGIPMDSEGFGSYFAYGKFYVGTTNYTKTNNNTINTRIIAPKSALVGGNRYTFSSWSGECDNDTSDGQNFCDVIVNGSTGTINATYVISSPSSFQKQ